MAGYLESELLLEITYDRNRFEDKTISRMMGHLQTLLENVVADPEQCLADVPMLTDLERNQMLVDWNDTSSAYPRGRCVHQLFEQQVEQTPDAIALVYEDQTLTYRQLNTRANQLAHYLKKLGVGPEVLVCICLERSFEMVIALMGILKAGGAYVPLDPASPDERLAFMLKDTQAPVLLTQQNLLNRLLETKAQVVCLDTNWEAIGKENDENPGGFVHLAQLAYGIYTSGSTGKPKAVLVPHRGLLNLINWHRHAFKIQPSDQATQISATAFDASVWEVWPYLTVGGCIHLLEFSNPISSLDLQNWLVSNAITIGFVPTPLAEQLLSLDWPIKPALRILLTGGDTLHNYPSAELPFETVNNYGPTENSVVTTSGAIVSGASKSSLPSIGRPISNVQVYILDRNLQPVPVGVPGQLHIGGVGLARGYFNRAEQTAENFIPHPFSEKPGDRLYQTGDLVRYLPDGNIEFLGRQDHQVKIRGFRIELAEIETVLAQHVSVREAIVLAIGAKPLDKRLVAYVVANRQKDKKSSELRNFLKQRLPDYMVPQAYIYLDALPLTPNGKVDRQALTMHDSIRPERENEFVAPQTSPEKYLAEIWKKLLGVNEIGIYDNFFELGGHSLLVTRVISHISDKFQVELPLHCFFEAPTVAGLTETLKKFEAVPGQVSATARILIKIDAMEPDEIRAMLREKSKIRGS